MLLKASRTILPVAAGRAPAYHRGSIRT